MRRHHHEYLCGCNHFAGQHLSGNPDRHSAPYPCSACGCDNLHAERCVHCGDVPTPISAEPTR